jgi:hypothetical protein
VHNPLAFGLHGEDGLLWGASTTRKSLTSDATTF